MVDTAAADALQALETLRTAITTLICEREQLRAERDALIRERNQAGW